MRLKTRLVLATSVFALLLTATLGAVFFAELLHGRIAQVDASNDVLAHELLLNVRAALQIGASRQQTMADEAGFEQFVAQTLQDDEALRQTMNAIVSYSPTVQDVSVSGANGRVLVATDPALLAVRPPSRRNFSTLADGSLWQQWTIVFGRPQVLDVSLPLQRNGRPFLFAHIAVRSTLLRAALLPWLRDAGAVLVVALLCSLGVAVLLSSLALRPLERISRQLEALSRWNVEAQELLPVADLPAALTPRRLHRVLPAGAATGSPDAEARVSSTIAEIDRRMRVSEQRATSLSQMLRTLKDGMLLLEADGTIAMQSDSVRHFLSEPVVAGTPVFALFAGTTAEAALREAFRDRRSVRALAVALSDDRDVEVSLDFAVKSESAGASSGAMLTLHDAAARAEIEREIEVSRRMASIGKLTAGVGHEVKNPIHAMVLHLELLRSKLGADDGNGASRHVDVLAAEMARLDRVVQVLADFSRPMEPVLREHPLRDVVDSVVRLVSVDAGLRGITIDVQDTSRGALAMVDREMLHQALLNIVLNALDAMSGTGRLTLHLTRDRSMASISVRDTGTGIAPDVLGRIFHLYFTTKKGGSGIGLAMTWRMVQMMGGTIDVQSVDDAAAPDRGTLMTVRLPVTGRSSIPRLSEPALLVSP